MYDDVLMPTDGSEGTVTALEHAREIAGNHDATLHVVHVVDRRVYLAAGKDEQDEVLDGLQSDGEDAIDTVVDRLGGDGLDVVTELREGVPHRELLDYAEEHDIDLIAIGTHGRSSRDQIVNMGSVTEKVVDNSERPVLVVHIEES
ncbi:universal stress protein [Halostella sp. JP-L12]|uniref:universal stress protein n=1 Tax=Halostella TaxID=1843185 RepID=UPI000EF7D7B4|nr:MULTISPECIES: universal stress protein [Halostella]NHN47162.1 universal stress protein [Halostella sp. JP-L12]